MPVFISMLRAVNVGGHSKIKMDALRALYASLNFENPQTYLQSGNVIFKTGERKLDAVAKRIQSGIEKKFACRTDIILRTAAELRDVVARNPFAKRSDIEPSKLLVAFLASDPGDAARKTLEDQKFAPEELHVSGCELYIYFPNGAGKSKLPWSSIANLLKTEGTARNWNSIRKILAIAEEMEAG